MKLELEIWNVKRERETRDRLRRQREKVNSRRLTARRALAAAVLATATVAADANPIVQVPAPTSYSDSTPLPVAKRHAAQVYCGRERGKYVQAWAVISSEDVVAVPLTGLRSASFCAATYVAQSPGSTDLRESDYSVEFTVSPITASIPLNPTVIWSQPAVCTTTCTVNRTR